NSLIGATPALLKGGIPDEAFKAIEGDDQAVCGEYKRLNQREREGRRRLLAPAPESDYSRLRADAWCAAFVWKKIKDPNHPSPITEEMFRKIEQDPRQLAREGHEEEIRRLAEQYRFFHWHLAFPDVFRVPVKDEQPENEQAGWSGGFEVVLGNPPWDQKQFREQEFFSSKRPDFAKAATGEARKQLIKKLETEDPSLFAAYLEARRQSEAVRHFVQSSGRAPLTARGRMNDFALFAETNGLIIRGTGRVGCILPSGIATDDTSKYFFRSLVESESLQSLYDFENRDGLFPEVDSRAKFCLITFSGGAANVHRHADFVFFANSISDLRAAEKRFSLSADEIALLNPNTRTCPIFRSRRDASITKGVYLRVPVLVREGDPDGNLWGIATKPGLFNMTADSARFCTRQSLETRGGTLSGNRFHLGEELYLPLYEGKMFGPYDHRAAHVVVSDSAQLRPGQPEYLTVEEHCSPDTFPLPRYWVQAGDVERQLEGQWTRRWILGWKEVTSSTNERTLIPGIFPRVGIGHKIPVVLLSENCELLAPDLLSCLSSLMCDFIVRQKLGGTSLTPFTFKQLPVFPPFRFALDCPWQPAAQLHQWVTSRAIELIYTASDLRGFVEDCGYGGRPFRWDEARRFLLRCELDAAYFHLYGIDREDADYILETFPIVKRKDEQSSGEYRTKRVILEIYDEMQRAMRAGQPYRTRLDPPPANGWFPPEIPSR
ncbi:MAG TPA: SAM-dependent DNA methyltransferase, partial [Blastocatellia bacterium]|nr:SAM-dependent DNA methyltransferase [Blastocatellia bacterium]